MAKSRTVYVCAECGHESLKWEGRCGQCGEWNTFKQLTIGPTKGHVSSVPKGTINKAGVQELTDVEKSHWTRIPMPDSEFDALLGGGLVKGAIILMGGEPGIGKSTFLLQLALNMKHKVLYISGEESAEQIKMRADRITKERKGFLLSGEVEVASILAQIDEHDPEMVIIDSIQTMYSSSVEGSPGSPSQLRICTMEFQKFAKQSNIPFFIIGHVTKEGHIAGPKLLEHIVDVVLQFEGEKLNTYRILRSSKNRFGSTEEMAMYQMTATGLRIIQNPSEVLLSQSEDQLSGCAIGISMEGRRPLLVEIQALVSPTVYSVPQRTTTGFDSRRLQMLLAVIEKRLGIPFGNADVFVNVVGGIRIFDPAIDLAVVAALISSHKDIPVGKRIALCGELGLTGEVRGVPRIEQRTQEALKLGFTQVIIPSYNVKELKSKQDNSLRGIAKISDFYRLLFT